MASLDAEAKRLGGGRPAGMQRQTPTQPGNVTPAQQAPRPAAAPSPAAPAAPAAAPGKRSWLGPIAGLAAGLGIAALMSHFGMGEALGNFMTMALLALVAMFAIRWVMGRMRGAAPAGPQLAGAPAGAQAWQSAPAPVADAPVQREALAPVAAISGAAATAALGTDSASFERIAKMIFVRMQAANDAADLEDLRKFTTPELFASLRLDLQERGDAKNQTDVVQLNAAVVDTAQEGSQQIVSVRFDGLIREDLGAAAVPFAEIWHLVKPLDGGRDWAIAGIAPLQ
jgi:predicted lipid-binding transport protein (Tim44 family)